MENFQKLKRRSRNTYDLPEVMHKGDKRNKPQRGSNHLKKVFRDSRDSYINQGRYYTKAPNSTKASGY